MSAVRNRLLRRFSVFVFFEFSLAFGFCMTWILPELVLPGVAVVTTALRLIIVGACIRYWLRPLEAVWRKGDACEDAELRAALSSLHSIVGRSGIAVAMGWLILQLLWLGLGVGSQTLSPAYGDAEAITAVLFTLPAFGFIPIASLIVDAIVADTRAELGLLARGRDLQLRVPRRSFIRPFVATAVALMMGSVLVLGGIALLGQTRTERAHNKELQAEQLLRSAALVERGEAPLPNIQLLEQLPETHASLLESNVEDSPVPVHYVDIEHNTVLGALSLPDGRVLASINRPSQDRMTLIALSLVVVLIVATPMFGTTFWLAGRTLTGPLERLRDAAQHFVEVGEIQPLERIVTTRSDEVGELAASFAAVLEILGQLSATASAVSAGDLSVVLDHPGALHDAFRGMLSRLNETVGRLRETSLELASAVVEIDALLEQQTDAALEQSSNIQQVAQTVTSLAAAASQIAAAARNARADADEVVETTHVSAAQIEALREHTEAIGQLLIAIAEVASRSDLLALNGSLEATRAGEAGRGFALVATEMRRLAERVAGTVEAVRKQVVDIEASSSQAVDATQQGRALAERTADAAREIDQLTAIQSDDTEQASLSVQIAADMVVKTTTSMSQVRAATAGLRNHANELERLLEGFELSEDG